MYKIFILHIAVEWEYHYTNYLLVHCSTDVNDVYIYV